MTKGKIVYYKSVMKFWATWTNKNTTSTLFMQRNVV